MSLLLVQVKNVLLILIVLFLVKMEIVIVDVIIKNFFLKILVENVFVLHQPLVNV